MKKSHFQCLGITVLFSLNALHAQTQQIADSLANPLLGRWEQIGYSEQGVQVDKKAPPIPQAIAVYDHNRRSRAAQWYGVTDYEELSRRENRAYDRWLERDSAIEVRRLTEAIALPYFVAFFADSMVSMYNKDTVTNYIDLPQARQYAFSPADRSLKIYQFGGYGVQWHAQVLLLNAERLILFLAEEAEVVEFVKTPYSFP